MDEETQAMFEEIVGNMNKLSETVENMKEEENILKNNVRNTIKIDTEKQEKQEGQKQEQKEKDEKNKILIERTENLIIAIDQLLDYIQNELADSMMNMPIGIVRMILNFALGSISDIVRVIPFDPKEICNMSSKIGTKPELKPKKLCSLADLVGKIIS
jgi:hypothetical protein